MMIWRKKLEVQVDDIDINFDVYLKIIYYNIFYVWIVLFLGKIFNH